MKKVILIEDRPNRQKEFLRDTAIELDSFPILDNVCGGTRFDEIKKTLKDKVLDELGLLNPYDVIIIHRSALDSAERLYLTNFVKENSKTLVFFSGGISTITLQNIKNAKLLTFNARRLYSQNFKDYLESNSLNILQLAFGKNWKQNLESGLLEKLSFYLKSFDKKPLPIVLNDLKIKESYLIDTYFSDFQSPMIDRNQLQKVNEKVYTNLNTLNE